MDYPLHFVTRLTAYYPPPQIGYTSPAEARLEGGPQDCRGNPLHTLQAFLSGDAPWVSLALDPLILGTIVAYGSRIELPAFSRTWGRPGIPFRAVDECAAARCRGLDRIDVCVADSHAALDLRVNTIHPGILWFSVPYPPAQVEP